MSAKKLTALWHSNAPWAGTGYSTQTKQVVERFAKDGHHIAVNANYGLQGTKMVWEGIPIFPMGVESYSNDTVKANYAAWTKEHPDGVGHAFCLFDAWTMPEQMWRDIPVSVWTMVDHMPIPPKVLQTLVRDNVTPIAVTEFGKQQIERAGVEAVYIPMAIDSKTYKPNATFEGKRGHELMGFPDDVFIVGLINANKASSANGPHRKAWGENILAFSIFAQDKPDVRLYLHTERYGNYGGLALDFLLKACGLQAEKHYKFVSQIAMHNGIPNEAMAAIYADLGVLLAPTLGEGFGLTVLEAQCAGVPAIVNNFSAQPELLGDGWLTEGQPWWDGGQLAWFNTPNVPSIVDALEAAYKRGKKVSDKARAYAMSYDADTVWQHYWRPYIKTLTA